jgi:hypothetical protein
MNTVIDLIKQKHHGNGIDVHPPANLSDIVHFEERVGFSLPPDFRDFYLTCNGFGCLEDLFNMTPLRDIGQHPKDFGHNWFYFSEYMIYSDTWGLRLTTDGRYEIFNGSYPVKVMTSSLNVFLQRFLVGNVFEPGGLYQWQAELGIR